MIKLEKYNPTNLVVYDQIKLYGSRVPSSNLRFGLRVLECIVES